MREGLWVICLCAQWCDVCRQYRAGFEALAREWPGARFLWVDVEDEEGVVGDVDVETFPTLLIGDGRGVRFLGPLLPQAGVLGRLLQGLGSKGFSPVADGPAEALLRRIVASRA
ncbi:thioredoxin family protein [Acidovorax sp. MR-S7]|jgi:thiol-disulfide isomerase/thioredoxin|uniref:thioredoxin family protein n=1 Tax=unclassified Acidovorax TaxID=2684926 RepID=UPI0003817F57|nr:thiol-disulfide isomerase and thioredoxins [Acidovorax sp. MR-S7]